MLDIDESWEELGRQRFDKEADVETRLIYPLLLLLKYTPDDIESKPSIVFREGKRGRPAEADYVVYAGRPHLHSTSLIVVEAKRPTEDLIDAKNQGESYAFALRAPLLLLTNGIRLEIWQLQPSLESELLLECTISDIHASRAAIETLISKDAAKSYCERLANKRFDIEAQDFGSYFSAMSELYPPTFFNRTVTGTDESEKSVSGQKFYEDNTGHLIISAESGCGKTSYAQFLMQLELERASIDQTERIPFILHLPDLVSGDDNIEGYLYQRFTPHCPHVGGEAFNKILRSGVTLLIDAFERIDPVKRDNVEGIIKNFAEDYQKSRIIIFTRHSSLPRRLTWKRGSLLRLSDIEQAELLKVISGESYPEPIPDFLIDTCRLPLVLKLVLNFRRQSGFREFGVDRLYNHWINELYLPETPPSLKFEFDRILTLLAINTFNAPITLRAFSKLCLASNLNLSILDVLVDRGVLNLIGGTLEFLHESIADYFRAQHIIELGYEKMVETIAELKFASDSQLPIILFDSADTAIKRKIAWYLLLKSGLPNACRALRFSSRTRDLKGKLASSDDARLLDEIIDGIKSTIKVSFPKISIDIVANLAGDNLDGLQIIGYLDADRQFLRFSFDSAASQNGSHKDSIVGCQLKPSIVHGRSLSIPKMADGDGRKLGLEIVRDELFDLIASRKLRGNEIWTEDSVASRLNHLYVKYRVPLYAGIPFKDALKILKSHQGKLVQPSRYESGQTFWIDDLTADIERLMALGKTSSFAWWRSADNIDLTTDIGRKRLAKIINFYYKRWQKCYREVVEVNFWELRNFFPHYQMIPLRYDVCVKSDEGETNRRNEFSYQWSYKPVRDFSTAGADVAFDSETSDLFDEDNFERHISKLDDLFSEFMRLAPDRIYECGSTRRMGFTGLFGFPGYQEDELLTIATASRKLTDDLKKVFKYLPGSGSMF